MECEFDCGLFGSRFRDPDISMPQSFGPMFEEDLAWPLAGQYFWGLGRWIYDCGHPTNDNKGRNHPNPGLARSELHPCKAIATARWEAVNFPENGDLFVPAIQFMFFVTRLGGYTDEERPSTLVRTDLEFIVDLPKPSATPDTFPIGHTPDIAQNTIVVGPRLLIKADFEPFEKAIAKTKPPGFNTRSSRIEPIVEPIRPKDPNAPPEQVKVTILLSAVPADDAFYGVILSLGWLDRDLSEARRVKEVKVTIEKVAVGSTMHDEHAFAGPSAEWQLRIGVNGRWKQKRDPRVFQNGVILLDDNTFKFHLADDDAVAISAHGEETDRVHDTYKDRDDEERVLMIPTSQLLVPIIGPINLETRAMKYFQDCVNGDLVMARRIVTAIIDDQFDTFAVENDPLGRIDPFHVVEGSGRNPIPMADIPETLESQQAALVCKEVGKSAELAEKPNSLDYLVLYRVETTPQIKET